ncbi:MAG: dienelactone hydrolase family protein [Thermomicrobiales bacterium]
MKQLNQFETYLVHEFIEDFEDGIMPRRDMVRRIVHITGGLAAAATVLTQLGVAPAYAQSATPAAPYPMPTPTGPRSIESVSENDPRVTGAEITYPGPDGAEIMAYRAMPAASATPAAGEAPLMPIVMICHENRGLNAHIRDVVRRWAALGYFAIAPDLLSREGGVASITDPAEVPALLSGGGVEPQRHVGDFIALAAWAGAQPGVDPERLCMQGFCFGGGITWRTATQLPTLKAGAAFYGPPPPLADVPNIEAAMLGVYSDDPKDFANNGRDDLAAALEAAGVTFEIMVYPGTEHAFHNDTSPRWNEQQAIAAWQDTVKWFATYAPAI